MKAGRTSKKLSSNKNKTTHSSPKKRKITLQAKHKILSKPKTVK